MPKEEIAKYINFPEFIHVTKDGEFDEKGAGKFFDKTAKDDKQFLNECELIKTKAYYDGSYNPSSYNYYLPSAFTTLIENSAKDNPEMQKKLLQHTGNIFIQSYGKNDVYELAEAVKKETVCKKNFYVSSVFFYMAGWLLSVGGIAFIVEAIKTAKKCKKAAKIPDVNNIKEAKKPDNQKVGSDAPPELVLMFGALLIMLGLIAHFIVDGDKLILSNDQSALKPFYIKFEKSMHQAYIEQEVAKECLQVSKEKQQLLEPIKKSTQQLLDTYDKNAKQQFQLLLEKSKQSQHE